MSRYVDPTPKYTDSSNEPLPNGLLYFYESGTSDQKTTYADVNQTIANPHPLVLNGDGSVPNCFYSGAAKVILADSSDVQQWERDPVVGSESTSFGATWDAISVYGLNEVVTFNDLLYVSIVANNQNNNPASVPSAWTQFDLLKRWNTNETYQVRDPVIATDFTIYLSLTANNQGNDPQTSPAEWIASGTASGGVLAFNDWDASTSYGEGGANIVTGSDENYYVSTSASNLNNDPVSSPSDWQQIDHITGGNIVIDGDTISSTDTNSDIDLSPNGTGIVTYNGVEIIPSDGSVDFTDSIRVDKSGNGASKLTLSNDEGSLVLIADGGNIFIQYADAYGTSRRGVFSGHKNGSSAIYHNSSGAATSTITTRVTGIKVRGDDNPVLGDPQTVRITFGTSSDDLANVGFINATNFFVDNQNDGGGIILRASDSGGSTRELFNGQPGGDTTIYRQGDSKIVLSSASIDLMDDTDVSGELSFDGVPSVISIATCRNNGTAINYDKNISGIVDGGATSKVRTYNYTMSVNASSTSSLVIVPSATYLSVPIQASAIQTGLNTFNVLVTIDGASAPPSAQITLVVMDTGL